MFCHVFQCGQTRKRANTTNTSSHEDLSAIFLIRLVQIMFCFPLWKHLGKHFLGTFFAFLKQNSVSAIMFPELCKHGNIHSNNISATMFPCFHKVHTLPNKRRSVKSSKNVVINLEVVKECILKPHNSSVSLKCCIVIITFSPFQRHGRTL